MPGYYPSGYPTGSQSPVSLVAYRINFQNQMERMGKGLVWNGVSSTDTPVVFMPITISAAFPSINSGSDPSSEVIGSQVFRFEYCYLRTDGTLSITPPTNVSGIAAIVADIAVIDSKSKVLLNNTQITSLAGQLIDWGKTSCPGCPTQAQWQTTPGLLRAQWQNTLNAVTTLPRPALSGIRLYERCFYLSPPVL